MVRRSRSIAGSDMTQVSHSRRLGPIVGYLPSHDSRLLLQPHRGALAGVRAQHAARAAERGPFAPVRVVVPNRNVETYLRMGVARACGIAANLQVTFLRKLLGRVAQQALPNGRVVDAQQIQAHLLALFHDEGFLQGPEIAPVRDYLRAAVVARRG